MPAEVRIDKGYLARSLAVLVLCLVCTSALIFWAIQDGQPSPTWGVALAASIIVGFVLISWVVMWPYFFVYRCPICHDRLPRMSSRVIARRSFDPKYGMRWASMLARCVSSVLGDSSDE